MAYMVEIISFNLIIFIQIPEQKAQEVLFPFRAAHRLFYKLIINIIDGSSTRGGKTVLSYRKKYYLKYMTTRR